MTMRLKCTRITQTMSWDCLRDGCGNTIKDEKGRPTYRPIPKWDICFEVIGQHKRLSGSFNLNTTFPEQASGYVLHGEYEFTEIEPKKEATR